jgi:hypothetical protein
VANSATAAEIAAAVEIDERKVVRNMVLILSVGS